MPQQLAKLPFIAHRAVGDTRTISDAWFHASEVAVTPIKELGEF